MFAGMITKILGFINKIVLARIVGDVGVGLYMMAYPTLLLTVTLTQLGLPVAISKLVAEAAAYGDHKKIKRILTVSFFVVGTLSIIFTIALMIIAPFAAHLLFTDERTLYPLLAITPIIPIVGIASVLRGYFQGMQNMKPYAYSQVIEQMVRISLVAALAQALLPYGIEYAAGGAMISGVIGELISLFYMLWSFKHKKQVRIRRNFWSYLNGGKDTFKQLMNIALPTTGSRLIGSISYFLEPIVVAQSLALAGVATSLATSQYGELVGYAFPVLGLAGFITHALHVSLVPTISEAAAQNRLPTIFFRLNQALKIALIAGGFSTIICLVFARPIMELMYHSPHSAVYIYVVAPFFFLLYFQSPLAAALQALDLAKAAMINSLIGAVVKIAFVFVLASRPELGIMGAALGFSASIVLVTLLHFATVVKAIQFKLNTIIFIKGGILLVLTGLTARFFNHSLLVDWALLPRTLTLILFVTLIYTILLFVLRMITKEELSHFPIINKWVA
ncbi:stage V sporulation protein B [Pullulanibacillus camelliae]|uniref:Stage V sporulation protein B n=2 Tax=Pullulanibacillus camelliae TaxID=1707096 RepID=A0A8J2YHG4_9BACL|nr:stage V sporulation protein B [Pullulanibacillus camelliae]